jgi:hypothetical protein
MFTSAAVAGTPGRPQRRPSRGGHSRQAALRTSMTQAPDPLLARPQALKGADHSRARCQHRLHQSLCVRICSVYLKPIPLRNTWP